jgi:hypothetical protein
LQINFLLVVSYFPCMISKYKRDIKTIIEILAFLLISFAVNSFYDKYTSIAILFFVLSAGYTVYKSYFKKYRTDTILFPTVNDEYSKSTFISFGVLTIVFIVIARFAFTIDAKYAVTGLIVGAGICLFGYFESPKGWITIDKNSLRLSGVNENIDTSQLKEILLKNDKITLTNIYGENKNSNQLKLDPAISGSIKKFLEDKLQKNEIIVTDHVMELT